MAEQNNIFLVQQQLSAEFNIQPVARYEDWMRELAAVINYLIQTDFTRLVNILYRLDVSELRLKQLLQQEAGTNAGELIATLIVERQLEKINIRNRYRTSNDIPDDEKW
ncbi:hypothetical protein HB364_06660 [Pseudoflavitalea sp. X16]|uniref:hypothetical protein n=1 Tax=Paraflavitalea devenefica TaxID=2716334 RepID=UPI001421A6CF|nr:hypothetical protein [Paraflavitalea devenefica]NII24750.1 hypothetical protein [Paraflavitalea devenefica]